jgi:hypothetical protein
MIFGLVRSMPQVTTRTTLPSKDLAEGLSKLGIPSELLEGARIRISARGKPPAHRNIVLEFSETSAAQRLLDHVAAAAPPAQPHLKNRPFRSIRSAVISFAPRPPPRPQRTQERAEKAAREAFAPAIVKAKAAALGEQLARRHSKIWQRMRTHVSLVPKLRTFLADMRTFKELHLQKTHESSQASPMSVDPPNLEQVLKRNRDQAEAQYTSWFAEPPQLATPFASPSSPQAGAKRSRTGAGGATETGENDLEAKSCGTEPAPHVPSPESAAMEVDLPPPSTPPVPSN